MLEAEKQTSPVLDLLAYRIQVNSRPWARDEYPKRKLALVIEGGAMRGIVSGGMVNGLEVFSKDKHPFDELYLASSGACAGVYYAAEQTAMGISVYYDELRGHNFINQWNILRGKPPVKTQVVVDAILGENSPKRIDIAKVLDYPVPLHIYGTDANAADWYDFYPMRNADDLVAAIHSTIHIPVYGGKPVKYHGRELVDGGISAGRLPVWKAIEDGATDVLVLWTTRERFEDYANPLIERIIPPLMAKDYPELAQRYWTGHNRQRELIRMVRMAQQGDFNAVNLEVIRVVNENDTPKAMETRPTPLFRGARAGREAVLTRMEPFDLSRDPTVQLIPPRLFFAA